MSGQSAPPSRSKHLHRWSGTPRLCVLLLAFFALSPGVGAQEAPATPLPLLPQAGASNVRPELLRLLEQVENQLADATAEGDQEDIDRLNELKLQLGVVQLQVDLEALQRENDSLRALDETPEGSGAPGTPSTLSGIEQEFAELNQTQANTVEQLDAIAEQHIILLEQLGQDMPAMPGMAAPATPAEQTAGQRDLQALRARFQKLAAQQRTINTAFASVSAGHAQVLAALAASAPAEASGNYTVQEGDSLSSIAQAEYGSEERWREILQANAFLADPDTLFVGTVLTIP